MGYSQNPLNVLKGQMTNKAVGLAHGDSMAMQVDPKDGVVVTGDASKIGGQTTMTEAEKKRAAYEKKIEARKIELANKKMEQELQRETSRAEAGARVEQRRQKRREQEGKDYIDPKTGNVVRRGGPLNQNDPKDGGKKMKDLPLNTRARYEEYRKRDWKQDETSLGKIGGDNITDLTKWQKTGKSKDIQRRMPRK